MLWIPQLTNFLLQMYQTTSNGTLQCEKWGSFSYSSASPGYLRVSHTLPQGELSPSTGVNFTCSSFPFGLLKPKLLKHRWYVECGWRYTNILECNPANNSTCCSHALCYPLWVKSKRYLSLLLKAAAHFEIQWTKRTEGWELCRNQKWLSSPPDYIHCS